MTPESSTSHSARQQWMAVLARSSAAELETALVPFRPLSDAQWLRRPETGLVMVRARVGGAGEQFNVGETPVTRCALRLPSGAIGMAWVMGRDTQHAEYAARLDAMLQEPSAHHALREQVINPIARRQQEARELASRKAAATTVSFYTLARGEDQP